MLNVPEEYRAWTSSSRWNDCRAITIEVSDCDWDWNISEKAWNSLVNLCVDICRRYGFRLEYDGTKNGSLTRHNMYANTNCPGDPFQARFPELANTVNSIIDGGVAPEPTPSGGSDEPVRTYQNGSTKENIYSDTNLTNYIGYLSPWEKCDCFGIFNGRAMVRYHVDGTNNYKIGFAKWTGGVQ